MSNADAERDHLDVPRANNDRQIDQPVEVRMRARKVEDEAAANVDHQSLDSVAAVEHVPDELDVQRVMLRPAHEKCCAAAAVACKAREQSRCPSADAEPFPAGRASHGSAAPWPVAWRPVHRAWRTALNDVVCTHQASDARDVLISACPEGAQP